MYNVTFNGREGYLTSGVKKIERSVAHEYMPEDTLIGTIKPKAKEIQQIPNEAITEATKAKYYSPFSVHTPEISVSEAPAVKDGQYFG